MKRVYRQKFRLYPNAAQRRDFDKIFGAVRWICNESLSLRSRSWKEDGVSISLSDIKAQIPIWKKMEAMSWLDKIPSQPLQEAVIDNDRAFQRFFKGLGRHPRFKKKHFGGSFRLPQPKVEGDKIVIPKFGHKIKIKWHRKIEGNLKSATIIKTPAVKYFVSFVVHDVALDEPVIKGTPKIGIDLGLTDFATLSTGEKVRPTKALGKNLKRLRKLSQILDENQVVCIEALNVKGMVKNRKLSRHISDAAWGEFISQLKHKSQWQGRSLKIIDRWFPSSKMCSECGQVAESLPLSIRHWQCDCGASHDRDVNAAKNILNVGQDMPDYNSVEKKTSLRALKRKSKSASVKQEPLAPTKSA